MWRGASTKWNNQVHKTAWSSCKNERCSSRTQLVSSTEQSILRSRKPRGPSRSDRASRRTLGRPAARYSPPRPHPCSSMPCAASFSFPFTPFFVFLCRVRVLLWNPCARSLSRSSSLLLSTRRFPFHTKQLCYTHALHAALYKSRLYRTRACANFGEALSSRHFRCAGIRTMNELACVVIAPTLRTDLSGQISFDNIHVPRRFDTHGVWPPFRDAGKQPSE